MFLELILDCTVKSWLLVYTEIGRTDLAHTLESFSFICSGFEEWNVFHLFVVFLKSEKFLQLNIMLGIEYTCPE